MLITGGAKSGKSEFAESLALTQKNPVIYLATMPIIVGDRELAEKIRQHKNRRPKSWRTIEVELRLDQVVRELPAGGAVCLLDCLSLFVGNILHEQEKQAASKTKVEELVLRQSEALLAAMKERKEISFLAVTNEVGSGIVPENSVSRQYRDLLGAVNKEFALAAKTVWLCCVGLPIKIKPNK